MLNKVVVIGKMIKDPEAKVSTEGKEYGSFGLSVKRTYKNENGFYDNDLLFCKVFGVQARNVNMYCKKGSLVAVTGRIVSRSYESPEKRKIYSTEIIADRVSFLVHEHTETDVIKELEDFIGME